MGDDPDKKKNARASWDDAAVDDAKSVGVTPSVAKVLLAMNPSLRDQGFDTMKAVRQSQNPNVAQQPGGSPQAQGASVYDVLKRLEADVKKSEAEIAQRMAALEAEKKQLHAGAAELVSKWLLGHDADILSPVTQKALKDFEKLLKAINFKTETYIQKHRSKR